MTAQTRNQEVVSPAALRTTLVRDLVVGLVVGFVAFAFRLLADGRLPNDHYMHLAWAQQLLLGDVPGRDYSAPGMPLMYTASAIVQHVWPGPFSDVVLGVGGAEWA